jgi:hypothetical protein
LKGHDCKYSRQSWGASRRKPLKDYAVFWLVDRLMKGKGKKKTAAAKLRVTPGNQPWKNRNDQ